MRKKNRKSKMNTALHHESSNYRVVYPSLVELQAAII